VPILNVQFAGEARKADGTVVSVPPQVVFAQRGPVVQVTISVGQQIATQVLQSGGRLPSPVSGLALIDTGATTTCVDEGAAQRLQLPVIDVVKIASASHAETEQNVYPIQIEVIGLPITINAARAVGAPLEPQGILVLIGRDVLQHAMLVYNGPAGSLSLSI
jgi:predicted aspartyl protease